MTAKDGKSKTVRVGEIEVNITLDDYVDGKPTSAVFVTTTGAPGVAGVFKHASESWESEAQAFTEVEPMALERAKSMNSAR